MLQLFFKAIRHKKEHTRRLPTGKVISIRAFDYNDPRTAKLKPGRGKDTATEDLFNPEFSGDLYDPKAVRAARQAVPKPVKTPKLISAQQGPDVSIPDLFATLDNAEKISYPDPEASQSGEAKTTERKGKMNAQDLLSWVKAEKARLEDMGRTQGGQYKAILGWLETAERLAAVPDDYVWPKVTYDGTDPRGWAMKVMDADFRLQKYAKFGRPLE